MILALCIVACIAVALIAGRLARGTLPAPLAVLLTVGAPAAAFVTLLASAPDRGSSTRLDVLGQYHPLTAPVLLGTDTAADFRIDSAATSGGARVALGYDGASGMLRADVSAGAEPVVLSGTIINGAALQRRTVLRRGDHQTILTRPWWCVFRCRARRVDTHVGTALVRRTTASLDTLIRLPLGDDSVTVLNHSGRDYIIGNPARRFTVNGSDVPMSGIAPPGRLEIGTHTRLDVRADVAAQQLRLLFPGGGRGGWDIAGDDSVRTVLVTATAGADLPGTLPVLNPAVLAPGAARVPYGGLLERDEEGRWTWHSAGTSRQIRGAVPELLPGYGGAESGHVIALGRSQRDARGVIIVVVALWLMGGALVGWTWRRIGAEALPLRVVLVGLFNTLLVIRGALAVRAWLLPPHTPRPPITFLAALIAMPALVACYQLWQDSASRGAAPRSLLRAMLPVALFLVASFAALAFAVPPDWLGTVAMTAALPLVIGTFGLAALERLLVGPGGATVLAPFAALDVESAPNPGYRRFVGAAVTLALVGASLFVVTLLQHTDRLMALAVGGVLGAVVLAFAGEGAAIVQPHRPRRRIALAAALAVVGGGIAFSFVGHWLGVLAGAVAGAWLGWQRGGSQPPVRPLRVHELVPPWMLAATFAAMMLVISLGVSSRIRVTLEYALAIGGLLVVARIFALAWSTRAPAQRTDPRVRSATSRHFSARDIAGIGAVLVIAALIYLPLGLTDPGFVLLYFSAAAIAALAGLLTLHRNGRVLAAGLLVVMLAGAVASMGVRERRLVNASGSLSTPQVRFAGTYHPDALEHYLLGAPEANPLEIVRTLQQYWGTDQYAAMGGTTGLGFFNAELSNAVVPFPVALTENVFSVFVLSEHGWVGGVAVLLLYLVLALALLGGALQCATRREHQPRTIFLIGLAAFVAMPALYMAAANGRLVPLTGQNMPLLGLLSIADVALGTWLAALAVSALPLAAGIRRVHSLPGERAGRLRAAATALGVLLVAAGVSVTVLLWRPTHAQGGPFRLDRLAAEAETFVQRGLLVVDADTIAVVPTALQHASLADGTLLARGIRASNRAARGRRGGGYCYEADPMFRVLEGAISVNGALCTVRVPAGARSAWLGTLRTDDGTVPAVITDGRSAVVLSSSATVPLARLGRGCAQPGTVRALSVRLGCTGDGAVLSAGHMMVTVESRDTSSLEINGVNPAPLAVLRPGDRLRAGSADMVMTTLPPGALAYARWENGRWRRLGTPFAGTWLTQVDSQLARSLARPQVAAADAVVTLDDAMHAALRDRIADACAAIPGARTCSVVLADPGSGEIRAYADSRGDIVPPANLPADANLRNHPSASAIKPIVALAALKAYPALARLEVDHAAALIDVVANVPITPAMRAARLYPQARVPWQGFLPASDNLYATTLGFLATAPARGELPAMRGSDNASRMTVAGRPLTGAPAWPRTGARMRIEDSPLARSLEDVFGVHAAAARAPLIERSFWQDAVDAGVIGGNTDLQRISPEPVVLKLDSVTSPRQLATFMIGGGENRWNNVALAQAVARIRTGRSTRLHILRSVGDQAIAAPPARLEGIDPQLDAVRTGMRGVITRDWGTARALNGLFTVDWIAKTGTLQEREWTGSVFLFAGGGGGGGGRGCAVVGAITVQLETRANPDGVATALFRDHVAPLLVRHAAWNGTACP